MYYHLNHYFLKLFLYIVEILGVSHFFFCLKTECQLFQKIRNLLRQRKVARISQEIRIQFSTLFANSGNNYSLNYSRAQKDGSLLSAVLRFDEAG